MGLKSQTAIHEVLYVDDEIQELILSGAASSRIKQTARRKGMRTLREDGMQKVAMGVTTFEEIELKTMDM